MIDEQDKDQSMAFHSVSIPTVPMQARERVDVRSRIRRCISPQAGHALEILGHAIDYLTDEYVHDGGSFSSGDPRVEAIQVLMSKNRQIYLACPEVPTFRERIRAWLHRSSAATKTGKPTTLSS